MARREIIEMICDRCGTSGADVKSHTIVIDNVYYETDLDEACNNKRIAEFAETLAGARLFTPRKLTTVGGTGRPKTAASQKRQNETIRAWARSQALTCNERGRVPGNVVEAWMEAGQPQGPFTRPDTIGLTTSSKDLVKQAGEKRAVPAATFSGEAKLAKAAGLKSAPVKKAAAPKKKVAAVAA